MKLSFLFWNTGKQQVNTELVDLIAECDADMVCLAEYKCDAHELLNMLRARNRHLNMVPELAKGAVTLMTQLPLHSILPVFDDPRYTIKEIKTSDSTPILFVAVHLPSKINQDDDDQLCFAMQVVNTIQDEERRRGHQNTVVIGDFNMNPFDKGMTSVLAFNSLPCENTARRGQRVYQGNEYRFFYNPTWNLLGDKNGAPGTFYFESPGSISNYWNTLDQIILRPALCDIVLNHTVCAPTSAGGKSLLSPSGRPECSDHLPISITLNLR